MSNSKRILVCLLAMGVIFSSAPVSQNSVSMAAEKTSTQSKKVATRRYVISKKAGTYSETIHVKVKAKKGYKVYYTTSGTFKTSKAVANGKSVSISIKKTTTLSIYAVKQSAKVTAKKMNSSSRKKYTYFKQYRYVIRAQEEEAEATVEPSATETPDSTSVPDASMQPGDMAPDASFRPDGTPPAKPDGSMMPPDGQERPGTPPGDGGNAPGGQAPSSGVDSYEAVNEYTTDISLDSETLSSTGTDENVVLVSNNASVSIANSTISRVSSESKGGDNASFYGVGAAILAKEGMAYINNSVITTDAAGAAGVFAYDKGTAYVANTTITTQKNTAGGIHAAGGGVLYAWDLNVETNGESSAAIRSDRGGGKMVVNGGSYISNGIGSPAIYSTADIAVANANLAANGSEAICIEGLNSIRLFHSDLSGNMKDNSQNDCTWNVILYQSMSGDSEVGNSTFEMNGGTLTAKNGGMFYTTNTESTFILSDVDITYAADSEFFLKCTGNNNQRGWGTVGNNGADCLFTAIHQKMEGDVIWDSISQLDFYMTDNSTFTGAVRKDESCAGNGGSGYSKLYIEEGSVWTVTGDSELSSLYCTGTIQDSEGKSVTIKNSEGTVYVPGDSSYTITVMEYQNSVDVSGASTASVWSDYEVEKPSQLD